MYNYNINLYNDVLIAAKMEILAKAVGIETDGQTYKLKSTEDDIQIMEAIICYARGYHK